MLRQRLDDYEDAELACALDEHSAKVSGIVSPKQLPAAAPANAFRTHKIVAWVGLAVLATTVVGAMFYFRGSGKSADASTVAPIRSIAVLPPKAFNSEVEDASLSLGMADALITRLSSLRKVVVRPTSAVSRYTGEWLNVNSVLPQCSPCLRGEVTGSAEIDFGMLQSIE